MFKGVGNPLVHSWRMIRKLAWAFLGLVVAIGAIAAYQILVTRNHADFGDAGDASLIVFELLDPSIKDRWVLLGLHFRNGELLKKEKILACDDRFVGWLWPIRPPIDNRYLVVPNGGVIDLAKKTIIHRAEDGNVLGIDNRKVIYRVDGSHRENGVYSFDLQTHEVQKLKTPGKWDLPGTLSPDGLSSAEAYNGQIVQHHLNGTKTVLAKNLRINYSPLSSRIGDDVPLLWLDNQRILTQRENGKLIIVGTDKTQTAIVDTPSWEVVSRPSLYRDQQGQIVYFDCTIDVENKKFASYKMVPLGHNFEVENNLMDVHQKTREMYVRYRYRGQEIGARWASGARWARAWERENVTTSNYLATFNYQNADLVSHRGIAVWSTNKGWTTITNDGAISHLLGWLK